MYSDIKSCVRVGGACSNLFSCMTGLRQGENLSPILFSLYLNDLHDYFCEAGVLNGIEIPFNDDLYTYLKIFVLLYADDTVLLGDTENDLQNSLNLYQNYCDTCKLSVNAQKSKVIVFSKGRQRNYNFKYNQSTIETLNEYRYLGIIFSRSGTFSKSKQALAKQATWAMYSLLRKIKKFLLPIDTQIELFEKTVKPILLYGCELWAFESNEALEKVQLKFLKHILKVKKSTPSSIIYGETGVFPLSVEIEARCISFWTKILSNKHNSLLLSIYKYMHYMYCNSETTPSIQLFKWINNIKTILIKCGLVNIWDRQSFPNEKWIKLTVKQRTKDLFINSWFSVLENNDSCHTYKLIKKKFGREKYITQAPPALLQYMIKFRTNNHKLPIEVGRWLNNEIGERACNLCNNSIGDEYHYIRKTLIPAKYAQRHNVNKFELLFNTKTN